MKLFIWLLGFFMLAVSCKQKPVNLQRIEGKQIPISSEIVRDSNIMAVVSPYKEELESKMSAILAYAPTDFYKDDDDKTETSIGNFMADLCYKHGNFIFNKKTKKNIDFVLLNYGGIRAGISKGDVTTRSAYEVMPFENNMVVVELTYQKIQDLLAYLAISKKAHPISKQLHISFKDNNIKSALLNGKNFDKNKTYFVLTSDYLQNGGNHMNFFKEPLSLTNLDYKIRKAILDELEEIDTIKAKEDGRVIRK